MSRRREEFAHRTGVFEGAFRAWSHLGGLDPESLANSKASDLDPLTNPIENDVRTANTSERRQYPYEPLPRDGLGHPFVLAIFPLWMGANPNQEAVRVGISTLRTWWQHRRKGETSSAISALSSEKMEVLVDRYTRHFFKLAHALVVNYDEPAPRTLLKQLKMWRSRNKGITLSGKDLKTLDRTAIRHKKLLDLGGQCIPGKLGDTINQMRSENDVKDYPVVFCSTNGSCQILLEVAGMTCARTAETVLKGCAGKIPIDGLIDAVAYNGLLLVHIDSPEMAPQIASECVRNLGLVGYQASPKLLELAAKNSSAQDIAAGFHSVGQSHPMIIYDWTIPCICPESGPLSIHCERRLQLNQSVVLAFEERGRQVQSFLSGDALEPLSATEFGGEFDLSLEEWLKTGFELEMMKHETIPIQTAEEAPLRIEQNMHLSL